MGGPAGKSFPWPSSVGAGPEANPLVHAADPNAPLTTPQQPESPLQKLQNPIVGKTTSPVSPLRLRTTSPINLRAIYG